MEDLTLDELSMDPEDLRCYDSEEVEEVFGQN